MKTELKKTILEYEDNELRIRKDFQSLIENGYFTINGVMFSLSEDKWMISESLSGIVEYVRNICLDFSSIQDEDVGIKIKLWIYAIISPYKKHNNYKMITIKRKLSFLTKCYSFIKSMGGDFLHPKLTEIEMFRASLDNRMSYKSQKAYCVTYLEFLEFVGVVWGISQENESIDALTIYDLKKMNIEKKRSIIGAIPYDFFRRLYDFCKNNLNNEIMDVRDRIICATIILFSQTGLRNGELYSMDMQPINNVSLVDDFGKTMEAKYIYAYITKSVKGRDTVKIKKKIPLTKDGEMAFNVLAAICKDSREKLGVDSLIVFPNESKKHKLINSINVRMMKCFFARYHRELDTLNTQEKYPTLANACISHLQGGLYRELADNYGEDAVLVYPNPTHFRKTFGTSLFLDGESPEVISKLLNQYSPKVTENYYIRPFFSQKDFVRTQETYKSILKYKANVLGKLSAEFEKRLKECIEDEDLANICQSDDELVEQMSQRHPLHAKEVGFCLMSDIHPCTVRTDEERLMCAFNTCPNIGFLFYDVTEHYKQMKSHEKAMKLNKQQGFELAAQKEANCLKYLVKTFLVPEIDETRKEILRHGKSQLVEWYPEMKDILESFESIEAEVMVYKKDVAI